MKKRIAFLTSLLLFSAAVVFATSSGPNYPTVATGNTNTIGGGTAPNWANPSAIEAADSVFATIFMNNRISKDLIGKGFGFTIPGGATINGILLEVNYDSGTGTDTVETVVRLLKAGVASGDNKSTGALLPAVATTVSYGGSSDLWGTTWTPSDINNTSFGAATVYSATLDSASVDFFRITVTYTTASRSFAPGIFGTRLRTQTRTPYSPAIGVN